MRSGFIFFVLFSSFGFSQKLDTDSLLTVINTSTDDSVRNSARMFYIEQFRHNYTVVSNVLFAGMAEARAAHDFYFLGEFHSAAGIMYSQIGNTDSALIAFQNSLSYRIFLKDTLGIAAANLGLSNTYRNMGDFKKAVKYGLDAERASVQVNDPSGLARIYNALGLIFKQQQDYKKALMYYNRAISEAVQIDDKVMLSGLYSNIGSVYQEQLQYDSAIFYHRQARDIRTETNDEMGLGISYGNFGLIFMDQGELDSALFYTNLALEKFTKFNYAGGISMCHASLGRLWQKKGDHQKALQSFKRAEDYAKAGKFLPDVIAVSKSMAESYKALGNFRSATEYLDQYIYYKDSLFTNDMAKEVQKMQMDFERQQEELADSLKQVEEDRIRQVEAEKTKQFNEQKLARQRLYTIAGSAGFVLVLVIAFILYRNNNHQRRLNGIIADQKSEVEEKNKEITDSITYAKRIQQAILPPRAFVDRLLPECFIFYRPKDIVAGDFYWVESSGKQVFVAAADCTGHGVPGAMVSVVCSNALNRTVKEFGLSNTGKILDKVRDLVIETFEKSEKDVKDGMDIALVSLTHQTNGDTAVEFSGANNPLWVLRKDALEFEEYKGDSQPIGKYTASKPFSAHSLVLAKGDSIYFFTDGYQDQFGGEKGKKFKAANLKKRILAIRNQSMQEQRAAIKESFIAWKGGLEQVDDVCVIGVRV